MILTSFMIVIRSLWSQKRMTCFMWDLSSVVRDSLSFVLSCNSSSGIIWASYWGHLRASAKKIDANLDFRAKDESQEVCLSEEIKRDWDAEMTNIFSYLTAICFSFLYKPICCAFVLCILHITKPWTSSQTDGTIATAASQARRLF